MPFIGRDWRSPGETWVKTDEGWEKKKILETFNRNIAERFTKTRPMTGHNSDGNSSDSDTESVDKCNQKNLSLTKNLNQLQPYCQITLKCTREVSGGNTISEALRKLDFPNAVRDIRRFNYICKLLHLLITQNLTSLSGCATKVLFVILEEVAFQVANNHQNIHILQLLLHDLNKAMKKYYCWGRPLGSTLVWEQHLRTIERLCLVANHIDIKKPEDDGTTKLTDLPPELIQEILLRLNDYKDLVSSGEAYPLMDSLLNEQFIWRKLTKFHFTKQQINHAINALKGSFNWNNHSDWKQLFHHLRKKYGLREEYADYLYLCRHCRCLFWKSFGHPCIEKDPHDYEEQLSNDSPSYSVPLYIPVPPQSFLKFFSL